MRNNAVKKAAQRAEKIHEEIYGDKAAEETPDTILDGLSADDPKPAAEEPGDEPVPAEGAAEPVEAAVTPQEVPNEPEPIQPDQLQQLQETVDKLDHKYKVLQGMHRKLLDEKMELASELDQLRAKPPAPVAAEPVQTDSRLISKDEIDDYGPEMIDVMKRAAREAVADEIAALKAENLKLHSELNGVSSQVDTSAKSSIYVTLDTEVPNWREVNQNDDFLMWLAEPDLFSGQQRQTLLEQAFNENDTARVIRFFKAYLNEDAAVAPATPQQAVAEPVAPKVDMRSMVAPGKPKTGGAPGDQTDTRVFTQKEINDFYRSVQLGKFPGTEADKKKMETSIIKAANEGRVQYV